MANAIRSRTVQKGVDPRQFALVAFGGAGPLHAADVAAMLGITEVIVPPYPGITSAMGLLTTDLKYDAIRTQFQVSTAVDLARLNADFEAMEAALRARFSADHVDDDRITFVRRGDLRYVGQGYELHIPFPAGEITAEAIAQVWQAFHAAHAAEYGQAFEASAIEIVNARVIGTGRIEKIARPVEAARRHARGREGQGRAVPVPHRRPPVVVRHDILSARKAARRVRRSRRPRSCCRSTAPPSSRPARTPSPTRPATSSSRWEPHHDAQQHRGQIDPITAAVIHGALDSIAAEMGHKLMRMSYSSIIRESEDFGTALTDAQGRQLCECRMSTPLQSGPIPGYIRGILKQFESRGDVFRPGDVIMHNDPYGGASHGPDVAFCVPIFLGDQLIGFSATTAHHLDIGALTPGSCGIVDAVDTYAEGLQFKAIKVFDAGRRNDAVWHMLRDNIRAPDLVVGDMEAQINAARIGAERYLALVQLHGLETVNAAVEDLMDYSERIMRAGDPRSARRPL